ncbi:MAG: hypothetical protein ACRDSP_02380 [Pseudonocardiaceae bacterium]
MIEQSVGGPLSSLGLRSVQGLGPGEGVGCVETTPLALQVLVPAPDQGLPEHVYDPRQQVATDFAGRPLAPSLDKNWTTVEGTHTDGDGGDNESWSWEE